MNNYLIDFLKTNNTYNKILENLEGSQYIHGMGEESLPHFIYAIHKHSRKNIFLITDGEAKARDYYESSLGLPKSQVKLFPRSDTSFHDIEKLEDEREVQRLKVMNSLSKGEDLIVIGSADSLVKKLARPQDIKQFSLTIDIDEDIDLEDLEKKLSKMAYERVKRVEAKGQYAVRGGIVDIFPIDANEPIRIELFDTEIDSIRSFEVNSQRSVEELDKIAIGSAEEMLLSTKDRDDIIKGLRTDLDGLKNSDSPIEKKERLEEKYLKIIDKLENNIEIYNTDLISQYLAKDSYSNILDYFDGLVIYDDLDRVYDRLKENEEKYMEDLTFQIEQGEVFPSMEESIFHSDEIIKLAKEKSTLNISQLKKKLKIQKPDFTEKFLTSEIVSYAKHFPRLVEEIKTRIKEGYKIIICTGNENLAERLTKNLKKERIDTSYTDDVTEKISPSQVVVSSFSMAKGFQYHDVKVIILTHKEIYGTERKVSRKKKKKPGESLTVGDLNIDDYVVHENHGIAIYKGLEEIEINGIKKDYLILEYRGSDKLYIPTDQMDLVQRYVSTGDKKPALNKLGTATWSKTKARAKKVVEEIAEELVQLYAERAKEKGYAFSKDSEWQRDFEASFEFEETDAQLRSIEEIKEDMESDKPMDRILLGDVGFGKTEVAIRAAFKAIMDGKQVAFLVPTTILAQQHYNNIKERLKDFPVNIEVISRFKTKAQQDYIVEKTNRGEVDFLIGTHRILSKDVKFKDLGLLIIDEEQRFGVKHKEKLKVLKKNIDVLTLTATPIPRTLQMGLVGIRDMSVLDEGPENRYPTSVYVLEYDSSIVRDAINREIDRDGQVYFVYNRVADMERITRHLHSLVPHARIASAHGQMSERQLEKIMTDFAAGAYDILVSTSIIETGMDIHNVNTMIIYNADYMGLSQLYQLKGRIGRGARSSYAYFTYEANKSLSEISEKRLKAIRDFSEQGSGLKIAMRDLELRGAGNILGESQSGHIDSIGYDLYMKFLEEAVSSNKNKVDRKKTDLVVDINIDSFIPGDYISSTDDKIEVYKKIAHVSNLEDYYDIIDELTDRFGDLSKEVLNVIKISFIKNLAQDLNFIAIKGNEEKLEFEYESREEYDLEDLEKLSRKFNENIEYNLSKNPSFTLRIVDFKQIYEFLETIREIQDSNGKDNLQAS